MSDQLHGTTLRRRVLAEHRRVILPLVAIFAVNVLVYAAGVYPLGQRVANIEERNRSAEQALTQARREYESARGALTGKERATVELQTFYKDVLPADLPEARSLTFLRLAQLAREAGLKLKTGNIDRKDERTSTLEQFRVSIDLEGSYDGIRAFLHQLDTAPEFVVIDDVTVSDQSGDRNALQFSMQVSTYYLKASAP